MKRQYLTSLALLCIQAFSSGMNTKNDLVAAAAAGDLDKVSLIATKTGTTLLGPIKLFDTALLELTTAVTSQKPYRTSLKALTPRCSQEGLAQALYAAIDTLEPEKVRALISSVHQRSSLEYALCYHVLPLETARDSNQFYRSISELLEKAHARENALAQIRALLDERLLSLSQEKA